LDKTLDIQIMPYNITFQFHLIDEILEATDIANPTIIKKSNIFTQMSSTEERIKNQINKVASKNNESSITSQITRTGRPTFTRTEYI